MPNQKTVTVTHDAVILGASNTDYIVQAPGVTMAFIGGSNDTVAFPHEPNGRLIAVNTTDLSINASSGADNLGVFVAGAVNGMVVGGWGNFDTGQTLTLIGEGHYNVAIDPNGALGTALISGLDGGGSSRTGSISFYDSPTLKLSQITGVGWR
jgi:hypothetical protein